MVPGGEDSEEDAEFGSSGFESLEGVLNETSAVSEEGRISAVCVIFSCS